MSVFGYFQVARAVIGPQELETGPLYPQTVAADSTNDLPPCENEPMMTHWVSDRANHRTEPAPETVNADQGSHGGCLGKAH